MKQETFTDMEYSFRKKKTKREEFPEIKDGIIRFVKMTKWYMVIPAVSGFKGAPK